jgi:DNA-binding transcriptional MerR regulator
LSIPDSEHFGIGELSQLAGVTPRTIRYYVTEGLLPAPLGAGPHRSYSVEHLLRLQAIQRLKESFLPLREIRRRLDGLSRSELAALAAGPDAPPAPAARPGRPSGIQPMLPSPPTLSPRSPGPTPSFIASLMPPRRGLAEPRLGAAYVLGEETPSELPALASESGPAGAEVEASVWNRVTLAPGVELSYQLTGDRLRDSAILRLVRIARQILA